jgi:hypothetical protein
MKYSLTGQLLRMSGLLIELLGLMVFLATNPDNRAFWLRLPGAGTFPVAWLIVAAGFVLWLMGTAALYRASGRRNDRSGGDDDLATRSRPRRSNRFW